MSPNKKRRKKHHYRKKQNPMTIFPWLAGRAAEDDSRRCLEGGRVICAGAEEIAGVGGAEVHDVTEQ